MSLPFKAPFQCVATIFADRLLQLLLLGVIGAGFLFALVLNADASIVVGLLVVGCVAAFAEAAQHRGKN